MEHGGDPIPSGEDLVDGFLYPGGNVRFLGKMKNPLSWLSCELHAQIILPFWKEGWDVFCCLAYQGGINQRKAMVIQFPSMAQSLKCGMWVGNT